NLSLASNELISVIPSTFWNLKDILYLNLSLNSLTGPIPLEIENLKVLVKIYFSMNNFAGVIPNAIGCLNILQHLFLGYNRLQGSISYSKWFSCLELCRVTNGFSEDNLISRGGFGSIHKARIQDRMEFSVKGFHLQCSGAFKSFDFECDVMKSTCYRNLIKIISSRSNEDFKVLVLEYMPRGSLEKCLYSSNYVGFALEYLHFDYSVLIIHYDLKPSNVLFDDNIVTHLSDFGIAKLLIREDHFMIQTQTLATIGYMASYVYSFGIMLLEVFTRKKPTNKIFFSQRNDIKALG
ncbi:hypothetical protein CISIN_1g0383511mg, partial [Citrus sinensis]